jgi:hypothetical protein
MSKIEPLETKQAILREIDNSIVAIGGGIRKFPYPIIEIRIIVSDEAMKGIFHAAFVDNKILETSIHTHLQPPRCEAAEPVVKIVLIADSNETQTSNHFEISYISDTLRSKDAEAYLEVLEGLANRKQLHLQYQETFIGRCEQAEARGSKIIRKNDLYFLDAREFAGRVSKELKENEMLNQSVSRIHAHIKFNERDGCYYIYDDGSSKGTTLLRGGRGVAENVDRNIGKELKNGDVICFGKTKVKFKLVKKPFDA